MYSATVLLKIKQFVPINPTNRNIVAILGQPQDISPPPRPKNPPVFSTKGKTGQSIVITVPKGYTGQVQLIYQLPDPRHVLLGVAFRGPGVDVGRMEFRDVALNRDPFGSQMTVTDSCNPMFDEVSFNYVILVQQVATGKIGIIDPEVETEENEN